MPKPTKLKDFKTEIDLFKKALNRYNSVMEHDKCDKLIYIWQTEDDQHFQITIEKINPEINADEYFKDKTSDDKKDMVIEALKPKILSSGKYGCGFLG